MTLQSPWYDSIESFIIGIRKIVTAVDFAFNVNAVVVWDHFALKFRLHLPLQRISKPISLSFRKDTDFKTATFGLLEICRRVSLPIQPFQSEPTTVLGWVDTILDLLTALFTTNPPIVSDVVLEAGDLHIIIPCVQPVPTLAQRHGFKAADNHFVILISRKTSIDGLLAALKALHTDLKTYAYYFPAENTEKKRKPAK